MSSLIKKIFRDRFGTTPLLVRSPGRVNLIGEHTDYNDGFVLPAAIDKSIVLAMARNDANAIRMHAVDMDSDYYEIQPAPEYRKSDIAWRNYIIGVVDELQKAGYSVGGFDCSFGGDIPIGAGLSSSAALECGVVLGLSKLFKLDLERKEMALIAQRAENRFVGVQCGIMDQFACLHGQKNRVIKLDCRSLDFERYPFEHDDFCILLCDTRVRRELAGSEYNVRRSQCEEGVALLNQYDSSIQSLREVSFSLLESRKDGMDDVVYRRCRYVLEENRRVQQACEDLNREDPAAFGEKMYQSHYGLRDDYEVSCEELDILVEATEKLDEVLGARMMGGGFGGCTINLVESEKLDMIKNEIGEYYRQQTGIQPEFHVAKIGEGAHVVKRSNEVHFGKV